jgi:hypothetical protein
VEGESAKRPGKGRGRANKQLPGQICPESCLGRRDLSCKLLGEKGRGGERERGSGAELRSQQATLMGLEETTEGRGWEREWKGRGEGKGQANTQLAEQIFTRFD